MTAQPSAEACPTCGGRSWHHLFESGRPSGRRPASPDLRSRKFSIARCNRCELVRTLGVDDGSGVATYPHFDQRETAIVKMMRFAVTQLLRERAALVSNVAPSGRLLDVGCGSGAFARLMSTRGYDAVGVEPFSLGRPVKEANLELIRAPFESVRSELGRFDIVTMWHVLEHIRDPKALLEGVLEALNPGGVMIISVPNFASWQSRVFKGGWFHLDPPRHITHFDRATLHALLEGLDLELSGERTFHFEYGPVGWLQSALNYALRPNFLFEFVKDRGALANVPKHETALNLLASGVGAMALAAPAVAVEAAAGAAGSGSVLTVCARRRGHH